MGHLAGKEIFTALAEKQANTVTVFRSVNNDKFLRLLCELYTEEEALLALKMPYTVADMEALVRITGYERQELERLLPTMCDKGLVVDLATGDGMVYALAPLIFGFFEFTMMRTGGSLPYAAWARLFHDYISGDGELYRENFASGQKVGMGRALAYEESVAGATPENLTEVLDYESALELIERSTSAAMGTCSCRHEKLHAGQKSCSHRLDTCLSFGGGADYLVRHGMARPLTKEQARESIARGKEDGLVLIADNVKKGVSFICQCCPCCCGMLQGFTRFGYPNAVATSNFMATVANAACTGCGKCAKACPVEALVMESAGDRKRVARVLEERCLGCGVCAKACRARALDLRPRARRVYHPEDLLERVLVSNIERGTLPFLVFDNPNSRTQAFLRHLLGAFQRLPPVRQALASEGLRSRFLAYARKKHPHL